MKEVDWDGTHLQQRLRGRRAAIDWEGTPAIEFIQEAIPHNVANKVEIHIVINIRSLARDKSKERRERGGRWRERMRSNG